MPTVINYNRARLNNIANGVVTLTSATSPLLLLTMGIEVAVPVSFFEIMSSVGFGTPDATTLISVRVDVDFATGGLSDIVIVPPSEQQLTFHTILENLTVVHHVIQLFASTATVDVPIDGPVTMSALVLA